MSIIAWDGKHIAADRQATSGQIICTCLKLFAVRGYAVGFVGREDAGLLLLEWFKAGGKVEDWPTDLQMSDAGATLIVAGRKKVWEICELPVFSEVRDPFWAWGTGREVALGAMSGGADARTAVETAIRFDISCGVGMDFFECGKLTVRAVKVK